MPDNSSRDQDVALPSRVSSRSDYSLVRVSLHALNKDLLAIWQFPDAASIPPVTIGRDNLRAWMQFAASYEGNVRGIGVGAAEGQARGRDLDTIGEQIFQGLMSPRCQTAWHQQFAAPDGRHLKQPVRIEFAIERDDKESPADYVSRITGLASIPLEAMRCAPTVLAGITESVALGDKVSIVRRVHPISPVEASYLDVAGNVRVLVFAPEPADFAPEERLSAAREIASIRECAAASGAGIEAQVVGKDGGHQATWQTLASLVNMRPPFHVFHFIGHGRVRPGSATVELLFEDEAGRSDWRDFPTIANELARSQVRLLVLNGCQTAAISALAAQFPAVVGMQFAVSDEAAQLFAAGFYRQLAESGQLDDAVWSGRRNTLGGGLEARAAYRHPVLYMHSSDGLLLRISPRIQETTLPAGRLGTAYLAQFTARGGRGPHAWAGQNLHRGLGIDPATGCLTGCPCEAGRRIVSIRVRSHDGLSHELNIPLEIGTNGGDDNPRILTEAIG